MYIIVSSSGSPVVYQVKKRRDIFDASHFSARIDCLEITQEGA